MTGENETLETLIGERLADAIGKKKIHQVELARFMDESGAAITGWVKGESVKGWAKLAAVCQYLGVSADEILGLKPPAAPVLAGDRSPVQWQCPCCGATLTTTVADG